MLRLIAVGFLLLTTVGCAYSLGVSTQKDLNYQVNRADSIYLALDDELSVDESNAYNYLRDDLKSAGFTVSDDPVNAKFVITCALFDRQEWYQSYSNFLEPRVYLGVRPVWRLNRWGRAHRGYWGRAYWWGNNWYDSPYVSSYDERVLKLRIFNAADFQKGKFVPVWEGSLWGSPDALETKLPESVKTLVDKIGDNFTGRISIKASN